MKHTTYDAVLNALIEVLSESKYNPEVTTTPEGDSFPRIVVEELENSELKKDNMGIVSLSLIGIKIEIYAKAKRSGTTMLSGRTIARELSDICAKVCGDYFGLKRTTCKPTPNVDSNIHKITMIYNTTQSDTGRSLFM